MLFRKNPREITLRDVTGFVKNCPPGQPLCPVQRFTSCCNEFITSDPKSECYAETTVEKQSEWVMTPLSWIIVAIAILLLIALILMTYFVIRYKNRSIVNIKKLSLEN